ncbi:hypothetical protein MHYP_G00143930 [Metynnis hypsauchen]
MTAAATCRPLRYTARAYYSGIDPKRTRSRDAFISLELQITEASRASDSSVSDSSRCSSDAPQACGLQRFGREDAPPAFLLGLGAKLSSEGFKVDLQLQRCCPSGQRSIKSY